MAEPPVPSDKQPNPRASGAPLVSPKTAKQSRASAAPLVSLKTAKQSRASGAPLVSLKTAKQSYTEKPRSHPTEGSLTEKPRSNHIPKSREAIRPKGALPKSREAIRPKGARPQNKPNAPLPRRGEGALARPNRPGRGDGGWGLPRWEPRSLRSRRLSRSDNGASHPYPHSNRIHGAHQIPLRAEALPWATNTNARPAIYPLPNPINVLGYKGTAARKKTR